MLFSGCWAVRVDAARLRVEAQHLGLRALRTEALGHDVSPHPPGGAELGHLLEDVVVAVEEEGQARSEVVHVEPLLDRRLHVGDPGGQREGDLLHGRAALLAEVIAGDRDRVPFRHPLVAVLEQVRRQPHRRLGRVDVVAPRDVLLEHVVLRRPAQLLGRDALLLADELVEQQQAGGGGVDGHRGGDLIEGDPVEGGAHVVDRVDRHPGAADLAEAARVVRVQAELGGQVEGHRQPRRALRDQVPVALVRLLRRGVARVLAHRPGLLPVHLPVHAAGVGEGPRLTEVEVLRQVRGVIELLDLDAGVGEAARVVGADDRCDAEVL